MGKFMDLTGLKFGDLTVIKQIEDQGDKTQWLCLCSCGEETTAITNKLTSGRKKMCPACAQSRKRKTTTHGMSKTRIYEIWCGMKKRCNNKSEKSYPRYGGRGISVCREWEEDFGKFYEWAMSNGYDESLSIDRIDPNGNYEPSNCRWITMDAQSKNKRNNIVIEHCGEYKILADWCKEYGINYRRASQRYRSLSKRGIADITLEQIFYPGSYNQTKIMQYTPSGEFIRSWGKISDANATLGINRTSIIQCCQGKRKTAGGYAWKYASD